MRRSTVSIWGLTLLLGGAVVVQAQQQPEERPPAGQQPPPVTFRVEVNYVEVDAIVTDAQGNFVGDLTKDDFQILENGKPQDLTVFSMVDIPIERAERPLFATAPIEPDVATNEREFEGRVYVIVLDDLHTHPLRSQRVRAAAREFIGRYLGANDLAAVVHTSGRRDAGQEFTSNPRLLQAAVDRFMGRKLRSGVLERLDEYHRRRGTPMAEDPLNDPLDAERGFQARNALGTVKNIAEWMAGIRGRRKALVLISEGIDYNIHDIFGSSQASTVTDAAREAVAAATRSNVSIYGIDPRGLTAMGDDAMELAGLPDDPNLRLDQRGMMDELRLGQDSLRLLAEETGGFAAVNSNDFARAFDRLVRDNSTYYVLGYYPADARRDGRFRKIDVRVTRPGLQVRARRGYVAPRGRAPETRRAEGAPGSSPELREALGSPLPVSGLTLRVFAAPLRGTAPNASVVVGVEIDGSGLTFADRDGLFQNAVELSLVAIDSRGEVRGGDRQDAQLKLQPRTYEAVSRHGLRLLSRIDLPPGRYQLRVAARESGRGALGSLFHDLEVPDFAKERLAMSGLLLTSTAAGAIPTPPNAEVADLKDLLPASPTAWRTFSAGDTLALFAEIYDNQTSPGGRHVDITTTLRADDGRVLVQLQDERSSDELGGARGGYGYTAEVPLRDIAPGLYVLKVEARSRLQGGGGVSREVLLRVRDRAAGSD